MAVMRGLNVSCVPILKMATQGALMDYVSVQLVPVQVVVFPLYVVLLDSLQLANVDLLVHPANVVDFTFFQDLC